MVPGGYPPVPMVRNQLNYSYPSALASQSPNPGVGLNPKTD